jgi:ribonuclease VapC
VAESLVLDSSAILASILGESGSDQVFKAKQQSFVSSVNMAEVRCRLVDRGMTEEAIEFLLELLEIQVKDFTDEHAKLSSSLRRATKAKGLSLGDRACLALAFALGLPALTADRAWSELTLPVEIVMIR